MDIKEEKTLMQQVFEQIEEAINRLSKDVAPYVFTFMYKQTSLQFTKLGKGGTSRGVTWKPFSPLYTRKGGKIKGKKYNATSILAWGGIDKVQGKNKVKGRKRGSSYITTHSSLLYDSGMLAKRLYQNKKITKTKLTLSTPVKYAKWQDDLRPFNFITDEESKQVTKLVEKRLIGLLKN